MTRSWFWWTVGEWAGCTEASGHNCVRGGGQ